MTTNREKLAKMTNEELARFLTLDTVVVVAVQNRNVHLIIAV